MNPPAQHLTPTAIPALVSWLEVIHHPFAFSCIEEWRTRVNELGLAALEADSALSILPLQGHQPLMTQASGSGLRSSVLFPPSLEDPTSAAGRPDAVFMEADLPFGSTAWIGFAVETESRVRSFRERAIPLVRLVAPSYRAAVGALRQLGGQAHAVARTMGLLGHAVMVVRGCGEILYQNARLCTILEHEPEPPRLLESMRQSALRLLRPDVGPSPLVGLPEVANGRYRPAAVRADPAMGTGCPLVLVRLEEVEPAQHMAGSLRLRFNLTPRQADVAALLLQGATAKRVAARLGISQNTARNHVQQVLISCGVSSKAELLARALHGGAAMGGEHEQ
jgi:DNA-binding CsgD family transcriptional regulator